MLIININIQENLNNQEPIKDNITQINSINVNKTLSISHTNFSNNMKLRFSELKRKMLCRKYMNQSFAMLVI